MAELGGGKNAGLNQLPQTPVTIGLAVLQGNVRELCLDTSDDSKLTTNKSNIIRGLGESQLRYSLLCELRQSLYVFIGTKIAPMFHRVKD